MNRPYRLGELVMMNYGGWLKAFRVVGVREVGGSVEYTLSMLETENDSRPGWGSWKRPTRS